MKKLTENEIKFIKETKWTPTVYLCGEYNDLEIKSEKEFSNISNKVYNIDIHKLFNKCCNIENSDSISLEYDATYLLYTFFSKKELEELSPKDALKWLQNFKYFFGYRKWSELDASVAIDEALQIYIGTREFYIDTDGEICNKELCK